MPLMVLSIGLASAQKKQVFEFEVPDMPINKETNFITYSAVTDIQATKDELYKRGINFFNSNYKNPSDVLKIQDPDGGEIEGVARFKILNPADKKGFQTEAGLVSYTINLKVKNDKYKYEITKINWKQISYYGIEKWMDKNSPSYNNNYDYYLIQTHEHMKELEEKLKAGMQKPSVQPKNNDW